MKAIYLFYDLRCIYREFVLKIVIGNNYLNIMKRALGLGQNIENREISTCCVALQNYCFNENSS